MASPLTLHGSPAAVGGAAPAGWTDHVGMLLLVVGLGLTKLFVAGAAVVAVFATVEQRTGFNS